MKLLWALWGCGSLVLFALGLAGLMILTLGTGNPGWIAGLLFACLPVPLYVALALWLDRFEPEPPGYLLAAFVWGAGSSVLLTTLLHLGLSRFTGMSLDAAADATTWAPLFEEFSKACILLVMFRLVRFEFDGIIDGVIYSAMVALGFAMTENVLYYGSAAQGGGAAGFAATVVLRGLLSPYAHPLFTSMTGWGLGWARQSDHRAVRWLAPPLGFAAAVSLHSLWNRSVQAGGDSWVHTCLWVMLPSALALLVAIVASLLRERALLRVHLTDVVSDAQLQRLQSIPARVGGGFGAFFRGGLSGWLRHERFNSLTSDLALLRDQVRRGRVDAALAAREEARLLRGIAESRPAR